MPCEFMPRCIELDFPSRSIVNETPDVPPPDVAIPAPTPSWGLWALCTIVLAAIIVAWSGDRAKPLVLFPLLMGAALGGTASLLANYCQLPRRRDAVMFIGIGAGVLVVSSFIVAANRQHAEPKPANPLAERLMQQFEQQTAATEKPATNAFETYLQQRYGNGDRVRWMSRLLGEIAVAGVGAAWMMRWLWQTREEVPPSAGTR